MFNLNFDYKSRFRILKGGKISLVVSAILGSAIVSFAAPTGGSVTSGTATISQDGLVTNINQATQKASINWNSFSIASNETVNFNQPNVNSITLNRVIGNERSVIDGALNANGQVWLLNSNGVLFSKTAKINTAGILATTKNISDEDFQAGNYEFSGNSTESVINMGEITASDSGYVAMLANTVQNDGTIKAYKGTIHLTGASEATINLNGNSLVNITVDKGALDTLVENKGAIIAEGGKIYLTTNAVDELLKGVVNNSGIIEANSFDDMFGEVVLFAHGGEIKVGGEIKARDGFVETSGREFTFEGADIQAGEWLIDPVYLTIEQTLATAIENALEVGDVTIETDQSDYDDIDTSSGETESEVIPGRIYINNATINPTLTTETTFTLKAGTNIEMTDSSIEAFGNALNVYFSLCNDAGCSGASLEMYDSSIKTNGGDIIIGGALTDGVPSFTTQPINGLSHNLRDDSTLDAGNGDITIAMISGTENAQFGSFRSYDGSSVKANNIIFKALKSDNTDGTVIQLQNGSLIQATGDIVVDTENSGNVQFELSNSTLQATGDITLNTEFVSIEKDEWNDGEPKIIADNLTVNATNEIEIEDAVIKINDLVELNSNNAISLSNSQILFQNQGILNINVVQGMTSEAFDGGIDSWITGWFEVGTVEAANAIATNDELMMGWAGRTFSSAEEVILWDEGVDGIYSSLAEYWLASVVSLPMITDLKGGTYNSKIFSNGTLNSIDTSSLPILNNGHLAFGDGLSSSITSYGMLKQPWYYDTTNEKWYQLTMGQYDGDYYSYPMEAVIAVGGSSYLEGSFVSTIDNLIGNVSADDFVDGAFSDTTVDMTGLSSGSGTIISTTKVMIDGKELEMKNTYTLSSDTAVITSDNELTNKSGEELNNVRFWVGTSDNYIAGSDYTTAVRGSLNENGEFIATTDLTDRSDALKVEGETAGVLFYTTNENSAVFAQGYITDDDYANLYNTGKFFNTSPTDTPLEIEENDIGYGVYANLGTLANGEKGTTGYTYASGSLDNLADVIGDAFGGVNESSVDTPDVEVEVATQDRIAEQKIQQVITTIANSQQIRVESPKIEVNSPIVQTQVQTQPMVIQIPDVQTAQTNTPLANIAQNLGLQAGESVSLISSPLESQPTQRVTLAEIVEIQTGKNNQATQGTNVEVRETRVALGENSIVELVNGGVTLPEGVDQEFYVVKSNSRRGNK